jgi:hypothetical protein
MEELMADELVNLRGTVLPLYRAVHELGRSLSPLDNSDFPVVPLREVTSDTTKVTRRHCVDCWSSLSLAADHFTEAKALAEAISQWADELNMGTDWFRDAVLMNLCGWNKYEAANQGAGWGYPGMFAELPGQNRLGGSDIRVLHGWRTLDSVIPVPVVRPYNPTTQTRDEHFAQITLDFNRYYEEQETLFAQAGFQKTIRKRARAGPTRWSHFDWFIKYQIQGKATSEIADQRRGKAVGEDAIYQAVKELAKTLEVALR